MLAQRSKASLTHRADRRATDRSVEVRLDATGPLWAFKNSVDVSRVQGPGWGHPLPL
jgi:hypothetical protein